MTRRSAFALLLLLLPLHGAAAQQHALDAHLRLQLRLHERLQATPPATRQATPLLAGEPRAAAMPAATAAVGVIVDAQPAALRAIEAGGGVVRARVGSIATASVPLDALPMLARVIHRIEAPLPLAGPLPVSAPLRGLPLRMSGQPVPLQRRSPFRLAGIADFVAAAGDAAAGESGVDRLRQLRGERFVGLAGDGVIVGIFDTGLDLEHADFRHVDGRTRVLYAWNQDGTGTPPGSVGPHVFGYGEECTAALIDAQNCGMQDIHGHGTHVSGIAAGNGRASPGRAYAGAAPNADLIVVKGGDGTYTSDRVLDGVAYMMERASALGRPIVVNLSVGTQSGPHDGTTLFESALEALTGSGRIIVAAAGNNGDNRNESPPFPSQSLHATGDAGGGGVTHELIVPPYTPVPGAANDGAVLEIWYPGEAQLAVTVTTPSGHQVRGLPGDTTVAETPDGAVLIDNAFGGPYPGNGDKLALVGIIDADAAAPPTAGAWRIEVERVTGPASVRHHMWLIASTFSNAAQLTTLAGGTTNTHLIMNPGTASELLTVAAYTTRLQWPGPDGSVSTFPFAEELGDIAQFSAPGPRRDGVLKPDITAPGKLLLAPRSRDATLWANLPWMLDETGSYAALLGTSMAAPYVAGVVALLLQLEPSLTPDATKALLTGAARSDAFTSRGYGNPDAPVPNVHWGAGKLDALAAVRQTGQPEGSIVADVTAVPGAGSVLAHAGAGMDLLRIVFDADSAEAVDVERLHVRLSGRDPAATLQLLVDGGAGDGSVVASRTLRVDGPTETTLEPGPLIAAGESRAFRLRLVLSGSAPHGATFDARLRLAESRARGVLSGRLLQVGGPTGDVASSTRQASLLPDGRRWSISENPVRSAQLFIVFDEAPRLAAIYTLGGALVRDLTAAAAAAPSTVEWRLDNARGTSIAPGVYLLVLDFPAERVLQRILVVRGG